MWVRAVIKLLVLPHGARQETGGMETVTEGFPCLNLLGVKGRKDLALCHVQDIVVFPSFFCSGWFFHGKFNLISGPSCSSSLPSPSPLALLVLSASLFSLCRILPHFPCSCARCRGTRGLETESTPCLHPARLLARFSSRTKPDPASRKAAALILASCQ